MISKILFVSSILLQIFILQGCAAKSGPQPITPQPAPVSQTLAVPATVQAPSSWLLTYKNPSEAQHGVTLSSEGQFEVGPTDDGESVRGQLEHDDLKTISDEIKNCAQDLSCMAASGPGPSGGDGGINLAIEGKSYSTTEGSALSATMVELAKKYYPPGFPNPCVKAAHDFEKSTTSARSCESSLDCSLIDPDLVPVAPSRATSVVLEDCSYVPTLAAANNFEVVSNQLKLLQLRELVQNICGKNTLRPHCTPVLAVPIQPECIHSICQISR